MLADLAGSNNYQIKHCTALQYQPDIRYYTVNVFEVWLQWDISIGYSSLTTIIDSWCNDTVLYRIIYTQRSMQKGQTFFKKCTYSFNLCNCRLNTVLLVTLFIVRQATTNCGFQFKNIPPSLSNTSNHKR